LSFALEAIGNLARGRDTQHILGDSNSKQESTLVDTNLQVKPEHKDIFKKMVRLTLRVVHE
jgi:hypothetical protein